MYSHARGKYSSLLNRLLTEFPGFAPKIILTVFLYRVNNLFTVEHLIPPDYSRFHYKVKIGKIIVSRVPVLMIW
jgi:hypothetical protein